jgi:hypothetical protein
MYCVFCKSSLFDLERDQIGRRLFFTNLYNIIVSSVEYWSRGGDYVRAGTLLSLACLHALIYLHACILAYGFYSFYAFYAFYGPLLDLQAYPAG